MNNLRKSSPNFFVIILGLMLITISSVWAAPEIILPVPGSTLSGSSETFTWSDDGVVSNRWRLTIGSVAGRRNIFDSGSLSPNTRSIFVDNLPVDGSTIFVRLHYFDQGSLLFGDFEYTASTSGASIPEITIPTPGSTLSSISTIFEWSDNGVNVNQWRFMIGSSRGKRDFFDSGFLPANKRSVTVENLPIDGSLLNARLSFIAQGARSFIDVDYVSAPLFLVFDLNAVGDEAEKVTRILGSTGNGAAGVPVTGGYDMDGDGFNDGAFAAIQASPLGRTGAGEVALVFGDGTIGGSFDTQGFNNGVLKIAGDQDFEVTGAEIWVGDITGDGIGDLLIGRQNFTPETGREGAGALTIIVGGPELRTQANLLDYLDLRSPPDGVTVVNFYGAAAYDRLGIWMRTGDIDGDGIDDLVVGSDEIDALGENNRGGVYVIRGGEHLNTTQTIDFSNFGNTPIAGHVARIIPPTGSSGYHMGATCQIADLDGNGRAEILAAAALNRAGAALRLPGAPSGTGEATGGSPRGTLYIAWDDNFPTDLWIPGYEFDISLSPGSHTIIDGDSFNDAFGEEIIGGLDYSADGNAELFVGDLTADGINGTNSGVGHVFFNAAILKGRNIDMTNPPVDVQFTQIEGPLPNSIGADTVTQGDYDGDGIGDLAICNPHDAPQNRTSAGSIHVIYGKSGEWPAVIDLSVGNLPDPETVRIAEIQGANATNGSDTGDTLCYSAAIGDMDHDGLSDLLVNEMEGNGSSANDVGNLLYIRGAALLPPVQ